MRLIKPDQQSIAEVIAQQNPAIKVPPALYGVPFPTQWDGDKTRFLLIEAIITPGISRFDHSGTDEGGDSNIRYSHSLIYLIDMEKSVISATFAACHVKGPRSYGGSGYLGDIKSDADGIDITGIERRWGPLKLTHRGIRQKAPGEIKSQENHKPSYFCVTRLDEAQHDAVLDFLECFKGYLYQIAGYRALNCDRFRRAAREAAGLPVSVFGLLFPFPRFRAAAIGMTARRQKIRLKSPTKSYHFGPQTIDVMLRRAYDMGLLPSRAKSAEIFGAVSDSVATRGNVVHMPPPAVVPVLPPTVAL